MFPPKIGKQYEVNLQQHASLLNNGVNKIRVLESAEVKGKMKTKFDKEEICFKSFSYGFHYILSLKRDGAWRWRSHLVKSWSNCKARHVKHHHVDNVHGDRNLRLFKFPLIDDWGGNVSILSRAVFSSTYYRKLQ